MKKSPLQYAFDLIKLRDRSEFEMRQKMKKKEFTEEEIGVTVKFLFDQKFLDDDKFTEFYVRSKLSAGRNGQQVIKMKLRQFGIDDEIIKKYLTDIDDSELKNAQHQSKKWLKNRAFGSDYERQNKLSRFLLGRGFNYDIIKKVVDERIFEFD